MDLRNIQDAYPLTELQLAMIFFEKLESSNTYHDVFNYWFEGECDVTQITEVFNKLAELHPVLRTEFELKKYSQPIQIIPESKVLPIKFISVKDARGLRTSIEKSNDNEMNKMVDDRFPVKVIVHHSGDKFVISLSFHHAILDGYSVALLMEEFIKMYSHLSEGLNILDGITIGGDYSQYVEEEMKNRQERSLKEFWFKKASIWKLNSNSFGVENVSHQEINHDPQIKDKIVLSKDEIDHLRNLSEELGVPMKDILLAVFLISLCIVYSSEEVTVGITTNCRSVNTNSLYTLGLFLNVIPIHFKFKGQSIEEIVRSIFNEEKELMPYRFLPLKEILDQFPSKINLDIMYNFIDFSQIYEQTQVSSNIKLIEVHAEEKNNFPLFCQGIMNPLDQSLSIELFCKESYFPKERFEKLLNVLGEVVRNLDKVSTFVNIESTGEENEFKNRDRKEIKNLESTHLLKNEDINPQIISKVKQSFEEVLKRTDISYDDNYFGLGGDSILSISLVASIYKNTSTDIEIKDVYMYPTIIGLSKLISEKKTEKRLLKVKVNNIMRDEDSQKLKEMMEKSGHGNE